MISEKFILDTLAWKHRKRTPLFRLANRLGVSSSWVSGIMRGQIPAVQGDPRILAWAKIVGMRHRVVHDYLHVDYDIVWGVATRDLPMLIETLATIVPAPEDEG